MKFAHSMMIVLMLSSVAANWAWSEENSVDSVDSAQQVQQDDAQRPPGGGGGRPQPAPVRPAPQPVRPAPEPVRVGPQPVRPAPEPVRPAPEPVRVGPEPIRPQPEPFRPGPNGRAWEPVAIRGGFFPGAHWDHPDFVRPVFAWDWDSLRLVTCSAEDAAGNIFPVTEDEYVGIAYQSEMPSIEDAALDMCYDNSGGDTSCYLVGCNPGY